MMNSDYSSPPSSSGLSDGILVTIFKTAVFFPNPVLQILAYEEGLTEARTLVM
jgi:hypothetical protein